ncbi:MAG: HU family DNA-binding protein [Acidobacteriota bacterium]
MSRKLRDVAGRTKADLVDAVYRRHGGLTKAEATRAVEAIFSTVKSSLQDGRSVRIRNFGAFEVTEREGRTGVNPASGERMFIPPRTGLTFRPSRHLKTVLTDDDED